MKNLPHLKVVVTGGGTGGHLFPGIALAEDFLERFPGAEVVFIGTGRQVDSIALGHRKFTSVAIHSHGLKGMSFFSKIRTLFQLPWSVLEAAAVIRRFGPVMVFGVGGYVTGPVVLAARLLGVPTAIHEQNSVPGITNRILGRLVDRIFISLPGSEAYFPAGKTILTGNPVRKELLAQAVNGRAVQDEENVTLLVLGGSQGAHRVNTLVAGAINTCLNSLPKKFTVIHQTGVQDEQFVRDVYAKLGISARVSAFFQDMEEIYKQADLVLSRAGATTLAEIAVLRKPAILIPYPYAADDHQEKNARYLVEGGAARMFLEKDLTEVGLGKEIIALLKDADLRQRMAGRAGRLAKSEATELIIEASLSLIAEKAGKKETAINKVLTL